MYPRAEFWGPLAVGAGREVGGGEANLSSLFSLLNLFSTLRPAALVDTSGFPGRPARCREGGAGRGCSGVRPFSPIGAAGQVWRNVENLPVLLEGRPGVPHFMGILLGGKEVIAVPTLLLVDVKSGSQGRERGNTLECVGDGWGRHRGRHQERRIRLNVCRRNA